MVGKRLVTGLDSNLLVTSSDYGVHVVVQQAGAQGPKFKQNAVTNHGDDSEFSAQSRAEVGRRMMAAIDERAIVAAHRAGHDTSGTREDDAPAATRIP